MALPEDEMVLARLKQGDQRGALELMMELHEETVLAFCVRTLRERELAEDVAQQVFIEAHRDIEHYRGDSSLRSWLVGIAHHRCQDAIKARNRRQARLDHDDETVSDHADPTATATELIERAQAAGALKDCLAELSGQIRETVLLRFMADMTYEEMSKVLGVKADTLCVRVARALPLLKKCLEQKGWAHE